MKKSGFDSTRRCLRGLGERADRTFEAANREAAEDVRDLAKVLVPQGETGRARSAIYSMYLQDTAYMVDFGPLAKILEGGTEERTTKEGASRGRGPEMPFVNPAIRGTQRQRRALWRKALKQALKNG